MNYDVQTVRKFKFYRKKLKLWILIDEIFHEHFAVNQYTSGHVTKRKFHENGFFSDIGFVFESYILWFVITN